MGGWFVSTKRVVKMGNGFLTMI